MNKITLVEVEHFYNTGKKYYLKEISHKEGKEYLESKGISPSTAADSIYIYRNFVTAHGSTRTTSALVIEYFLNRIHIELGDIGLRNATTSLSKHIKHYTGSQENKHNIKKRDTKQIPQHTPSKINFYIIT